MSWKETLTELDDKIGTLTRLVTSLHGQVAIHSKRVEALRVAIETSERTRSHSADRMADRLIQMAMVNKGMGRDAGIHRRAQRDEVPEEQADLWQEDPETEWPPKGLDALNMP